MSEFFHKVFNTTVENVLSPRIFSSGQIGSDATANAEFFAPERELRGRDGCFSRRDMMPARNDHVSQ